MPNSINIPFSTTIIIPFNISSNEEDIISENSLKDTVFYEELRQYLFRISNNKNSIIDKFKYHTYISNYLGSNENKVNDLSFLETFFIDPEKVNKIIKDKIPFNFFFNRINLKLGKSNLHFGLNEPLIILNKKIKIGYVIFRFRFIESSGDNDKTYPSDEESLAFVEALSKIDFFRFFNENRDKHCISCVYEDKTYFIPMIEIINGLFSEYSKSIIFTYPKPILFHHGIFPFETIKDNTYYNLLRIPPKDMGDLNTLQINSTTVEGRIKFICMNEGALIIDRTTTIKEMHNIFNKYFPAFIIALNQREIMMKVARIISEIPGLEIEKNSPIFIEKLSELRKLIHILQLKQVFYSISNFNEVACFYKELQIKFNLELLLNDNKDSIDSIHGILDSENSKKEKLRNQKIENFVLLITIIGGFTTIIQIIEYFGLNHYIFKIIFLLIILMLAVIKRKWIFKLFDNKAKNQ